MSKISNRLKQIENQTELDKRWLTTKYCEGYFSWDDMIKILELHTKYISPKTEKDVNMKCGDCFKQMCKKITDNI